MRLWVLDDIGGWGKALALAANRPGWSVQLGGKLPYDPCHAFLRINQGGVRMDQEKALLRQLVSKDFKTIPSLEDGEMYENKLAQTIAYGAFMPRTHVIRGPELAHSYVGNLGYPFLSKSSTGSASCNVRLIKDAASARREIAEVFGDYGMKAPHRLGEQLQRDYLIWQEFLPGNAYDYRVCKIGRPLMILRRGNRDDLPFASGSGKTEAIVELDAETKAVYDASAEFFHHTGTNWCGIDLVKDLQGKWKVLETTIGWSQKAYANCTFFGPTKRKGAEIFDLTCDELEAGVWG